MSKKVFRILDGLLLIVAVICVIISFSTGAKWIMALAIFLFALCGVFTLLFEVKGLSQEMRKKSKKK